MMLLRVLLLLTLSFITGENPSLAQAADPAPAAFLQAVGDYNAGRFEQAARGFESLAQAQPPTSERHNGALCYNIGNSWLKHNDLGRAILWYERGLAFIPADPDLKFNLEHARSQVKDQHEPDESVAATIFFFWKDFLGRRVIQYAALAANAALWLSLVWLSFQPGRPARVVCGAALLALVLVAPTAVYQLYEHHADPRAVVLAPAAAVRSGLTDNATELFTLHAGSTVRVEEQRPGYARIRFGKDKIGWIKDAQIGVI